ncbi:hypothetical protein EOPP23_12785 [Endozoicomonas sp. OPT23]|uniref:hypothetical protein n=1 Tax=Endozoicomonas sp. OPT23 TaxID=2072845 RepID=UPI00129AE863|nr:hypothetical protein [Endozoicomonas sp. OPT23]MRI33863.1 hypothetical protein [Endozoicomonas sp. OPT23]
MCESDQNAEEFKEGAYRTELIPAIKLSVSAGDSLKVLLQNIQSDTAGGKNRKNARAGRQSLECIFEGVDIPFADKETGEQCTANASPTCIILHKGKDYFSGHYATLRLVDDCWIFSKMTNRGGRFLTLLTTKP